MARRRSRNPLLDHEESVRTLTDQYSGKRPILRDLKAYEEEVAEEEALNRRRENMRRQREQVIKNSTRRDIENAVHYQHTGKSLDPWVNSHLGNVNKRYGSDDFDRWNAIRRHLSGEIDIEDVFASDKEIVSLMNQREKLERKRPKTRRERAAHTQRLENLDKQINDAQERVRSYIDNYRARGQLNRSSVVQDAVETAPAPGAGPKQVSNQSVQNNSSGTHNKSMKQATRHWSGKKIGIAAGIAVGGLLVLDAAQRRGQQDNRDRYRF